MREIVNILVAAVACRFIQDRHAGRYLGSKRVMILVGNSPARATNLDCKLTYVIIGQKATERYQPSFIVTLGRLGNPNIPLRFTLKSTVEYISDINGFIQRGLSRAI